MSPKKTKKVIIIAIIVILLIVAIASITKIVTNNEYKVKLEEITEADAKYFILIKDNKYGVIDKEGQVVIEPKYNEIKIPNPSKDIFICSLGEENSNFKAINSNKEEILKEFNSVDAISIRAITSLVPYEKTVLKYKQGNLWGLMDFSGKKITEAIYEEIRAVDYKEGFLKVKKEGLFGVINIKGKEVLKAEYDNILSDGYYNEKTKYEEAGFILRTKTDSGYRFGYARANGKIVLDTIYNEVNRITEIEDSKDIYLITSLNGKYGLRKNNKTVLENDFTEVGYDRTNKLLVVEKNSVQGVYDLNGKNIIPMDYSSIAIAGEYIDASKDEETIIFDSKGNNIDTDIVSLEKVSDNYSIAIDKNNNYNILDNNGNKLLNQRYSYLEYFTGNLFIATNTSNAGVIDANGKIVVPLEYSTVQKIEDANCLKATVLQNNKVSIINSEGKMGEGIEEATVTNEGDYIKVSSSSNIKYYTLDGKETTFKEIFPKNDIYATKQNDKWGFKDKDGKVVIPCIYDLVTEQNGNFVGVKQNGKWGVLDIKGNIVKEPSYELSWDNVSFLGEYYAINSNVGIKAYCGDQKN